jgi:hypothetical protein
MIKALQFNQEYIAKIALAGLAALVLGYVVCLGSIMYNASLQTSLSHEISKTTSALAELEFDYITLKQGVTLEKAYAMGFVEIDRPYFVEVSKDTAVSLR